MYPIIDLVDNQTIAAVQSESKFEIALQSHVNIVFLLTGSILNVADLVDRAKQANKHVFLHMEFIEGISADKTGVAHVAQNVMPTGIISTRNSLIKMAKEMGLMTIQRVFLIDRNAIKKIISIDERGIPDAIEVMPGLMPSIISEITELTTLPIIAGGLVSRREEVDQALRAGALAVSTGTRMLWFHDN